MWNYIFSKGYRMAIAQRKKRKILYIGLCRMDDTTKYLGLMIWLKQTYVTESKFG